MLLLFLFLFLWRENRPPEHGPSGDSNVMDTADVVYAGSAIITLLYYLFVIDKNTVGLCCCQFAASERAFTRPGKHAIKAVRRDTTARLD
mmetsp:Transcript_24723/g.38230  ORF Transcript_24723/g.38230 Transcript_24723/m.38230 type:complete len:90 (+) Transcript_24723:4867-5136(+)